MSVVQTMKLVVKFPMQLTNYDNFKKMPKNLEKYQKKSFKTSKFTGSRIYIQISVYDKHKCPVKDEPHSVNLRAAERQTFFVERKK